MENNNRLIRLGELKDSLVSILAKVDKVAYYGSLMAERDYSEVIGEVEILGIDIDEEFMLKATDKGQIQHIYYLVVGEIVELNK
jgi:hypothetical protein